MSPFSSVLRDFVPRPCCGRPFICDGLPERCSVVVIGENPVTQLGVDWWSYWDDTIGFRYPDWARLYRTSREQQGKRPVSNTRQRLDRLRRNGVCCLETNVFFNERPGGAGWGTPTNVDLLDLTVSTLPNVRFVIAHGRKAHEYLERRALPSNIATVFRTGHFRSESYDRIDRISREIQTRLTWP